LLLGESGTGKELLARALHRLSPRAEGNFVAINCAAIPENLLESELFGHEKGAFTGAHKQTVGKVEVADGGTLFLDEIGDMSLKTQAKVLRALQEQVVERVGGASTVRVDVRVLAATNKDLNDEVAVGRFRADLFYRLNVYPITMPPLRKRRGDIPLLVEHFIALLAPPIGKRIERIPRKIMDQLKAYDWPGNVRELRNVIERSIITSPNSTFHVPDSLILKKHSAAATGSSLSLEEIQRQHIQAVLEKTDGRIEGSKGAAEMLQLKPSTLRHRMKKLGIKR